ncbi:hypothetical protein ACVRWE_09585 [Streptococcus urinalis]|uniref:Uncharacterized protein n=1 Tax=Streptococcus urinalis 2285-97 TaxID=764291 RepID=G5KGW8_9STRE|nr:hypothetical protein [Streptococcus urinalis]EHJ57489.1 hypothetical protein STRUR_1362 [Streptococcus urinalis 2285-97]
MRIIYSFNHIEPVKKAIMKDCLQQLLFAFTGRRLQGLKEKLFQSRRKLTK